MSFFLLATLLDPAVYFLLNFLLAMGHELELGLLDSTRVWLVLPFMR